MASQTDFVALWADARKRYEEVSGKKLNSLPMPKTTEDLISSVDKQNDKMKHFREKSGPLFTVLSAACKPIELVGNLAAGAAGAVFPPSSMVFGAAMYLINAAKGVSASLDAITELLGTLRDFTVRLKIYNREQLSQELRAKLTDILTTVIEIFARSTKIVDDGVLMRLKSFGKNILLGNDTRMQGLLAKLEKLTTSEDRLVGAETLVETKKVSRNVEEVQAGVGQVQAGVGQILTAMEEQKEERDAKHLETVKNALRPSASPQDRFDEIKRDKVPGSGDWIRDEPALKDWLSSKSPILWISGGPGSGKSYLTYNVITRIQDIGQEVGLSSTAWFFFRDNKEETRSFDQALRDMAFQIAQSDQVYAKYLVNVCRGGIEISTVRSAWQKLFVDFFLQEDNGGCDTYLIFDGIDEAFEEDRHTFFELLRDVEEAGANSRLHIAMLGRPQVIEEIADKLDSEVPTIHVDWSKNGTDIKHYVESSIKKSRVLNKVSKKLKEEVVQTLTVKANGMFMWVRLMIAELSKKSRESAIRDALNKAPRGLTEMLRHVLVGFSASFKDEQDAEDLNDILAWVTLAKRPLALGEIDAMLRLKSEEGDGVLNLEGKLRKQFATFFVLTRDDALTTADLQAPKKHLDADDEEDVVPEVDLDDGVDDVDNETDFNSNPKTTTVAFAHASIGDFFRDEKEGKVSAPGKDSLPVGVDLHEAQIQTIRSCLNVIVDEAMQARMEEAVSIRVYATNFWQAHLAEAHRAKIPQSDKLEVGTLLARMLQDKSHFLTWIGTRGYSFFTTATANTVLSWLIDTDVIEELPEDDKKWIKSIENNPIDLWEEHIRFVAARWLHADDGPEWLVLPCVTIVGSYVKRKNGEEVTETPTFTAKEIETTAKWAGFEETGEWYRKVAMTMREKKFLKEALRFGDKAFELDPTLWRAVIGQAKTHSFQGQYQKAVDEGLKALKLGEADKTVDAKDLPAMLADVNRVVGNAYEGLAREIDNDGDMEERYRLMELSYPHFKEALLLSITDEDSMWACLQHIANVADPPWTRFPDQEVWKNRTFPELPSRVECQKRIMALLHEVDETPRDDGYTLLDKYLAKSKYIDVNFEIPAEAAAETGELAWLQERYKRAIALANKDLQPVTAAFLSLGLARLFGKYGNDEEKAIRIWETIGTEGSSSTRVASDISYARTLALNALGTACIRRALADESDAARWISKMERIAARKRYGATMGVQDAVPPNDIVLYLAAWYRKQGRLEEAREVILPHIKDALVVLSDDDPNNDMEGWVSLSNALFAVGDDVNAIAIMHSVRRYNKEGLAVFDDEEDDDGENDEKGDENNDETAKEEDLTSTPEDDLTTATAKASPDETESEEKQDSGVEDESVDEPSNGEIANKDETGKDEKGDEANEDDEEGDEVIDDDDDDDGVYCGDCEGSCKDTFISFDDVRICRYCLAAFCDQCHAKLVKNELQINVCGPNHDFLTVPILKTRFKEGELLVGDTIMPTESWKTMIKKEWGL